MSDANNGNGPKETMDLIKRVCGEVVAEKLVPLQSQVTEYGAWINGAKATSGRIALASTGEMKGLLVGGMMAALAGAKGDPERAVANLTKQDKDKNIDIIKALTASEAVGGGVLIQEQVSSDFIDLLTARAVVRSFNPIVMPMDSGGMTVPKLTAASTAYYIGENRDATKSQQSFGAKRLTARKLAVLVPISNDLIRRGGPKVGTIVRNDAVRSAGLKEDVSFIRSQGSEFTPKGLRYQAAAANILTATGGGTYDLDSVTGDLGSLILALEESNVMFSNPGWILAPRTKQFLMTIRDGLGNFAFRAEMLTGKLWGWPFKVTTQIPTNLSNSSSEIYLADFDDVVIGDTLRMEIAVSQEAPYRDENNELQSSFSLDQTVMRLLMEHDIVLRHDESVGVLTDVRWVPGGGS